MTPLSASKIAGSVRGLFPKAQPEQIDFLAREFVHYDEDDVTKAIERHVRQYPELRISTLLADIGPRYMVRDMTDRERAMARAEEERIAKIHDLDDHKYTELTAGMSQERIDELKAQVLAENPSVSGAWKEASPGKCRSLRWHIIQILSRANN